MRSVEMQGLTAHLSACFKLLWALSFCKRWQAVIRSLGCSKRLKMRGASGVKLLNLPKTSCSEHIHTNPCCKLHSRLPCSDKCVLAEWKTWNHFWSSLVFICKPKWQRNLFSDTFLQQTDFYHIPGFRYFTSLVWSVHEINKNSCDSSQQFKVSSLRGTVVWIRF